jgi:hypothetical protein
MPAVHSKTEIQTETLPATAPRFSFATRRCSLGALQRGVVMAHPPGRIGKSFAASVAPTPTYARPAPTTPPPHSILNLPSRVPSFAPAVVTARPTPEFHQHHDIEPPDISAVRLRPAWLVKTRLLQLREYGLIVEAQFDAAVRRSRPRARRRQSRRPLRAARRRRTVRRQGAVRPAARRPAPAAQSGGGARPDACHDPVARRRG